MKLVASSKLHKAEAAIEAVRPYERALEDILSVVDARRAEDTEFAGNPDAPVAVVALSSNSSLCGAFNSNVIHKASDTCAGFGNVRMFSVGRKMSEAMNKLGHVSEEDYSDIVGKPDYAKSAAMASSLIRRFRSGEFSRVFLIYNKFVSTSSQIPVVEQYLPYVAPAEQHEPDDSDYIFEPDPAALAEKMLPYLLSMKFHAAVLDSVAAEHAARTIAMQTASENAERLLSELTLEYNKGRQEKITSEILDLESGESGD